MLARGCGILVLFLRGIGAVRLGPAASAALAKAPSCTNGAFGSTPYLQGVQTLSTTVEPLDFTNFSHAGGPGGLEGLMVHPQSRVAMCTIEKNGCSSWITIFDRLLQKNPKVSKPDYWTIRKHWNESAAAEVFRDPSSVRILWVRDPLERFLSGFLNKCMTNSNNDYPMVCPFDRRTQQKTPGFPLAQVQVWLSHHHNKMQNPHFTPQSDHCELKRRLHEYNVIGLMTSGTFASNAECVMELAHLTRWNTNNKGEPFFKHKVNSGTAPHDDVRILKKFFTKQFANQLLDIFKEDYELFRLERPAWVEEATGEWFHLNSSEVKKAKRSTYNSGSGLPVDDDLVTLAARAGFVLDP